MANTNTKKTIMDYNLAKALMEGSMQHFDVGGVVQQPNTQIGDSISGGVGQGVQTILSPLTGLTQGISKAFTVQNPYEAQLAPTQQYNYSPIMDLASTRALEQYQDALRVRQQQQQLANQLAEQGSGKGPNPAQMQLGQNTADTIAAQRALQAGQRGAGQNVGLLAKQAGDQGAAIQQRANNQAAVLQAQQQLAAQEALARQQASMNQGILGQQGIAANLFGTSAQAQNAQNYGNIQNYGMAQDLNRRTSAENSKELSETNRGLLSSIPVFGKLFGGGQQGGGGGGFLGGLFGAEGGEVPEHIRDIAKVMHPQHFENSGGYVRGKEVVKGDSYQNDIVPAMLSAKEVVLPKSVTESKDPPSKAYEFMMHLQKEKGKQTGYEKIAEMKGRKKK